MSYLIYYHDHLGNQCYIRRYRSLDEALDHTYTLYLKMRLLDEDIVKFNYIKSNETEVYIDVGNQRKLIIRKEGH